MLESSKWGFTLVEFMVAITIGALLLALVYAPYNFYANKSRVRLSAERVEQALSKSHLLAATGYAPLGKSKNVDIGVLFTVGATELNIYALDLWAVPNSGFPVIERVPLESFISITKLTSSVSSNSSNGELFVVFRSPGGTPEYWSGGSKVGGTWSWMVGVKGAITGALSHEFSSKYE